jgi:transposase
MDRGIVSEENLEAIRQRGGQYLVGTPRKQMKRFETELLKEDWTQVRPDVEVKQVAIPQGNETYILCRTTGRKEKEKAIRKRFSTRMEDALKRLEKTIAGGRLKDRNKMERRLGKIQARHSQVNDLFEITLRDKPEGLRLVWGMKEERKAWRDLREGAYMLRTNLQANSTEELWSKYMQLTEAEASFRALKSELSIRPLFHQKEPRVKARIQCGARHHNPGGRTTSPAGKGIRDGRTARNCEIRSVKLKRSKDYVRIKREGQPDWIKQLNPLPEGAFERVSTE